MKLRDDGAEGPRTRSFNLETRRSPADKFGFVEWGVRLGGRRARYENMAAEGRCQGQSYKERELGLTLRSGGP
jgi:hypothetical protein